MKLDVRNCLSLSKPEEAQIRILLSLNPFRETEVSVHGAPWSVGSCNGFSNWPTLHMK